MNPDREAMTGTGPRGAGAARGPGGMVLEGAGAAMRGDGSGRERRGIRRTVFSHRRLAPPRRSPSHLVCRVNRRFRPGLAGLLRADYAEEVKEEGQDCERKIQRICRKEVHERLIGKSRFHQLQAPSPPSAAASAPPTWPSSITKPVDDVPRDARALKIFVHFRSRGDSLARLPG